MKTETIKPPAQKTVRRRNSTEKRRREILDAALACFLKNGVSGTTIEQIRQSSNASHGSIYHLFRGKDEIALTLFVEGMRVYHRKITAALEEQMSAQECIRAIIRAHMQDVVDDPELSIYLTRMGMAEEFGEISQQYEKLNDEFVQTVWARLESFVNRGQLVRLHPELYFSLIVGPVSHFCRNWLRRRNDFDFPSVVEELSQAAWMSLQANDGPEQG